MRMRRFAAVAALGLALVAPASASANVPVASLSLTCHTAMGVGPSGAGWYGMCMIREYPAASKTLCCYASRFDARAAAEALRRWWHARRDEFVAQGF